MGCWTVIKSCLLTFLALVSAFAFLFLKTNYRNSVISLSDIDAFIQENTEEADLTITDILNPGKSAVGHYQDADGVLHEEIFLCWHNTSDSDLDKTYHVLVDPTKKHALYLPDRERYENKKLVCQIGTVFAAIVLVLTLVFLIITIVTGIIAYWKEKKLEKMPFPDDEE